MEDYLKTLLGITPARSSVNPGVGMFGVSPYEAEQARLQDDSAFATNLSKMSNLEMAKYGLASAGAGAARGIGGMMGMVDPRVEQAKQQQSIQSQIDHNSVEGLMKGAQLFNAAGNPRMAFMYTQAAQAQKAKEQEQNLKLAQEAAAWQKSKQEASPISKINPKDYTTESLKAFVAGGMKDPSVLVGNFEDKQGKIRTYQKGEQSVTEELQSDGTWKQIGVGPKFSKSVINVGTGIDQGKDELEPDVVDFYANQALLTGDQSWRTGLGRSKDGVKLIIAVDKRIPQLAKEAGMTPQQASDNKQEFAVRQKALRDFSTGTQGQMVNSFNTAINHLDTLKNLGEALKNGDMQIINKVANTVKEWSGNADVTNLDTAKQIVGAEIIKSIVARGGGVSEREEAASRISRISSPDQLIGYIKTSQELMAGQLYSLERQYEQTTKRKDFKDKLLPRSKQILGTISSSADKQSIPSGALSDQIPTEAPAVKVKRYNPLTGKIE